MHELLQLHYIIDDLPVNIVPKIFIIIIKMIFFGLFLNLVIL